MSKKEQISDKIPELNLGPIMNMVVILIPLLLLSVVFAEVGVINITAPKMAMGPATDKPPDQQEEPLNLTLTIEERGFRIAAKSAVLPPADGCPSDEGAPTLCLRESNGNAMQSLESAVAKLKSKSDEEKKAGSGDMMDAVNQYDWKSLYNKLVEIKSKYPDETVINITAEPTMPYAIIVRAMDVSRYKLVKDKFEDWTEFWSSEYQKEGDAYAPLFPDPVLNLAR